MSPTQLKLPMGEVLFREGDPSGTLYYIKEGTLLVYQQRGDFEIPLEVLKESEFVGTVSIFTLEKRSASVKALTDVVLDVYQDLDPQKFLAGVPSWVLGIFKDVKIRLKRMDHSITLVRQNEKNLQRKLPNRFVYAGMLCRLLKMTVESRAGGDILQVNFPISQFSEKASLVLKIPEEVLNLLFQEILKSRYLYSQVDEKGELELCSPDLNYLDDLAEYFEERSQMKVNGESQESCIRLYNALGMIEKRANRGAKPLPVLTKELEGILGESIDFDWSTVLFRRGALANQALAGETRVTVDLDQLDRCLDQEEIGEAIQSLKLTNQDPFFSI
ncbi:MAG: cyclic nucleotide-binding domain-containing protein [Verrucomicrobiota bacterium]